MQINSKFRQKFKNFFYLILNEFSNKFDNNFLKKISDIIFIFSEKITLKLDYFLKYYISYYNDMMNKEIKLGSISRSDRVVHIGCGSIPASSILIAQKTGAKIVGIDKDKKTVKNAKSCIKKLNLSDKIQIENVDALDFSFDNYDIILVAHGIRPITKFLKYLSGRISKKTIIIFRTFSDDSGNLSKSDEIVCELFNIEKIVRHEKQGKVISVKLSNKN